MSIDTKTPALTARQQVEAWHIEWLNADGAHWGDRIEWGTADEIARRLDVEATADDVDCTKAPEGFYCTQAEGHPGPCDIFPNFD